MVATVSRAWERVVMSDSALAGYAFAGVILGGTFAAIVLLSVALSALVGLVR